MRFNSLIRLNQDSNKKTREVFRKTYKTTLEQKKEQ